MDKTEAFVRIFEKVYASGHGIDEAVARTLAVMAKLPSDLPASPPAEVLAGTKPTRK